MTSHQPTQPKLTPNEYARLFDRVDTIDHDARCLGTLLEAALTSLGELRLGFASARPSPIGFREWTDIEVFLDLARDKVISIAAIMSDFVEAPRPSGIASVGDAA